MCDWKNLSGLKRSARLNPWMGETNLGIGHVPTNSAGMFSVNTIDLDNEKILENYARRYASLVNANKIWSWQDDIQGGDKLNGGQKQRIKEQAIELGLISQIPIMETSYEKSSLN